MFHAKRSLVYVCRGNVVKCFFAPDVSRATSPISKTSLCVSGRWYILGRSRELDAIRRRELCGTGWVLPKLASRPFPLSCHTAMRPDADATLPDYLPDRPDILFAGINPGSYSARQGHYYARRTNRFWWALHASGLVPVRLSPQEDWRVIEFGLGLTDLVKRPTNSAADVRDDEFAAGRQVLADKIIRVQPLIVCFNGLTGYQQFFREHTSPGRQGRRVQAAWVFVLPSTSARNAAYSRDVVLGYFRDLGVLRDELRRNGGCQEG
jgi:double-stranded uracil-DNA glycosylase